MPPRKKYIEYANTLKQQIERGEYLFGEMPSERSLAAEADISHMTVRKSLGLLVDKGVLCRNNNGKIVVNITQEGFYGILIPAYSSLGYQTWINRIMQYMSRRGLRCCKKEFVHWGDNSIQEALESLSGVFILPPREEIGADYAKQLLDAKAPVIIIGDDYTEFGLRSLMTQKYTHIQDLLDYIAGFGHNRIDCLNTEPLVAMDHKRLSQWKLWLSSRSCEGKFINDPVNSYEHAHHKARKLVLDIFDKGKFDSKAIVCTTQGVALGVMSALWSKGLQTGKDVAVAAFDGEGFGNLFCPPLTSLESPDMTPYLDICIDWMQSTEQKWVGSLLLAPEEANIFKGESV